MPATLTDAGLLTQTLAEIRAELTAALQDPVTGFGPLHDLSEPTSPVAVLTGIAARREAQYQSLLASLTSALYPAGAAGTMLDRQATLVGSVPRIEESHGTVLANLTGHPDLDVSNKLVRYIPNQSLWRTPGLAIIDLTGNLIVTLRAEDPGPIPAAASSEWEIVSVTAGWDAVVSIEPAQTGELEEADPIFRDRLANTDSVARGTEPAIYARLLEIPGVTSIAVDNNRELVPNINGVPGKSVESLVIGGEDAVIAEVLHQTYECDSGSFGNTTVTFTNDYGKEITIQFSRVDEIQIYAQVILLVVGAETPLPTDYEEQTRAAFAARAAQMAPGQDLQSAWFVGAIVSALPVNSVVNVAVTFSLESIGPFTPFLQMTSRQRALLQNGATPAVADSLQKPGGFDITAGWQLDLSFNGGPTVSTVFVGGVGLTSQAIAAEVQAAIVAAGEDGNAVATGALNRLRVTTIDTGPGINITILPSSTVGLLAELGGDFAAPGFVNGVAQAIVDVFVV